MSGNVKKRVAAAAVLFSATLLATTPGMAGAQSGPGSSLSSLGSSGSSQSSSELSAFSEWLSSSDQERRDRYLHEQVDAGNIARLVAEGHLRRLVELGYVEKLIMAGFIDELVEIGYYEPAIGIEESGVCPAVVVITGRGSGQNFVLVPTRYSDNAPWVSNGREAETWRRFFHAAEAQYQLDHPGQSLMEDVYVLGLDESLYPATHIRPTQDLSDAGSSAGQVIQETASGFFDSVERGTKGVKAAVGMVEDTGCSPQYILAGYSQGAAALAHAEESLAERGTLAGAIYLGNPLLETGSPWLVGEGAKGGGVLRIQGPTSGELAATENRVEYCLHEDLVCDLRLATSSVAASGIMGTHLQYFTQNPAHRTDDEAVLRTFATWVDEVRGN
ncbi:Cutinase [Corynebacterium occultum]|uniref:Cutinase n=1 Tax=Corynebacterium occultum TaxID=2675219 RepID=A0A6B8WDF4_9CORY|nr:cutinase family protein [Corynebacterium occultum]QGU08030.1 Cutinase [Corynebacterium occultum]